MIIGIPYTGRTHQLRLHLQAIGHPIANDSAYVHHQIHNLREADGNTMREKDWREQYHWDFDDTCDDCINPKGDPLEDSIWLHAWKYSYNEKQWMTEKPSWALESFDASIALIRWNAFFHH